MLGYKMRFDGDEKLDIEVPLQDNLKEVSIDTITFLQFINLHKDFRLTIEHVKTFCPFVSAIL